MLKPFGGAFKKMFSKPQFNKKPDATPAQPAGRAMGGNIANKMKSQGGPINRFLGAKKAGK